MSVVFSTVPQAPQTTIYKKDQLRYYLHLHSENLFCLKIEFVEIEMNIKWAKTWITYKAKEQYEDSQIYTEYLKLPIVDGVLKITNYTRVYNYLKPLLVVDGEMDSADNGAIVIGANEFKKYITGREFKVLGKDMLNYENATAVPLGSA